MAAFDLILRSTFIYLPQVLVFIKEKILVVQTKIFCIRHCLFSSFQHYLNIYNINK